MRQLLWLTLLSAFLMSCNSTASADQVQTAIAQTQAAEQILENRIQTAIAQTQAAQPTLPATQTKLPTVEPTATETATAAVSPSPSPTMEPTASAMDLLICEPDTSSLCILFFAISRESLVITLKQDEPFTGSYHMIISTKEYACDIYNDETRLFCTGPMQPTNQNLQAELYVDSPETLIAIGDIIIPPWPTPTSPVSLPLPAPPTQVLEPTVYP